MGEDYQEKDFICIELYGSTVLVMTKEDIKDMLFKCTRLQKELDEANEIRAKLNSAIKLILNVTV